VWGFLMLILRCGRWDGVSSWVVGLWAVSGHAGARVEAARRCDGVCCLM
jgi:hypothetical protein